MRGLPMDYPDDPEVRDLSDQWLFGPALMPCPVYEYKARTRSVYLPAGGWYDFYTGVYYPGGGRITADAPYARMPLYVRAGSILPIGPAMEYTDQKPADEMLIVVYAGADARFTLYEDDGVSYAYEKGQFSTIEFFWDEEARQLHIGERKGTYPGVLKNRTFRVRVLDPAHPQPYDADGNGAMNVVYAGTPYSVRL